MPIENAVLMEPMHRIMPIYPAVFDVDFTTRDLVISLFYNYMMWFSATLVFHVAHPSMSGAMWLRSLKVFGLMMMFFCSLAAIYMNHYTTEFRAFYVWSMVDAMILFPIVGLANGLIYPLFFRTGRSI
jgi:phosphatidylglycerophosphate synthase